MKVLVINCGSSSLKYQLIDSETEQVLAKGICERIKLDGSLTHQATGKEKIQIEAPMPDHSAAVKLVLQYLLDEKLVQSKIWMRLQRSVIVWYMAGRSFLLRF